MLLSLILQQLYDYYSIVKYINKEKHENYINSKGGKNAEDKKNK